MRDLRLVILLPDEAQELRVQAQAVLRSLGRRKRCSCPRPWRGPDGYCERCGRWIETVTLTRRLRRYIDAMETVESERAA